MYDLKILSTQDLITKLRNIEIAGRFVRGDEALRLYREWRAVSDELNARPTAEVLAS